VDEEEEAVRRGNLTVRGDDEGLAFEHALVALEVDIGSLVFVDEVELAVYALFHSLVVQVLRYSCRFIFLVGQSVVTLLLKCGAVLETEPINIFLVSFGHALHVVHVYQVVDLIRTCFLIILLLVLLLLLAGVVLTAGSHFLHS